MPRVTYNDGDVWSADLANAAGYPILDGQDEFGHGEKVIDDWLDDGPTQIKARFYGYYNRLLISPPPSGLTVNYSAYTVALTDGTRLTFGSGTMSLPNDTSGFIFLNELGEVAHGATLPDECAMLYAFTTSGGSVASLIDLRNQVAERIVPTRQPSDSARVGDVKLSARPTPETGWLVCDGASYAISAYPLLHTAIGTAFNLPGDAPGVFRVPDLRGRVPQGASASEPLGTYVGAASTVLTLGQLPRHNHSITQTPHTHTINGSAHTHTIVDGGHFHNTTQLPHSHNVIDPGHTHGLRGRRAANLQNTLVGTPGAEFSQTGGGAELTTDRDDTNVRIQASTINLSVSTATSNIAVASAAPILSASSVNANITLADAGASQPVNLKQPTATLNYFIKAL